MEEEGAPQCGDVLVLRLWLNVEPVRFLSVPPGACVACSLYGFLSGLPKKMEDGRARARAYGTRYGTGTIVLTRLVEYTLHLQENLKMPVLNVAFTPKTYVAPTTRCELSSKVTVYL